MACLVILLACACHVSTAIAADSIEAWRNEAVRIRALAESSPAVAYQRAKQLQASLPANASPGDMARVLNLLSRIEIYLAFTAQATRNAERALEIASQGDDRIGQLEANLNLALNSIVEARMDIMAKSTAASVELAGSVERPDLLGEALLRMAMLYHRRGQLDESITMSMQAMEIATRSNDPTALAYAHQGLSIALGQSEHFKEAYEHALKMRDAARLINSKMLEGYAALSMGVNTYKLGDKTGGEALIRGAVDHFRALRVPFGLNHALYTLADFLRAHGRHADALPLFSEIVATYEKYPNRIGLWYALVARSGEYLALGNRAAALTDAEIAFSLAKEIGLSLYITESAQQIAALHAARGDYRQAYDLSKEAASLIVRTEREKMSARVVELTQRYETEAKRRQIDELTRRNEQQQAELRQRELQQHLLWTILGGSFGILAATVFFLMRLRGSHRIIRELNTSLEQRVQRRTSELRQQTRYLRTLIDALPLWVWLKDTRSRYLAVNLAAAEATGHRAEELVGKSDRDVLTSDLAEKFIADDEDVMSRREQKIVEERQISKSGPIWLETFKAPVLDEDGTVLGTVGFSRDISERKAIEADREAALAEAQRLARLRSDLLAQISHELRTPLNGILGYAQILRLDRRLDERQVAGLNVIRQSGEHLLTLINDILDSAKIEAGRLELYPSDISLQYFLHGIAEMISVRSDQKGLDFVLDASPNLPSSVRGDEKRLRQVLLNLLSNAVKFTDLGRVVLRVGSPSPNRLRFEVWDSGIGMSREQMEEIFQPFGQTGEVQRRFGGTGLGLAISRQFVRLMGGDIKVESKVGEGSRFWFELELPFISAATDSPKPEANIVGYQGPRKSVLIVDDIEENRAVARDMLAQLGFAIDEASNGREAIQAVLERRPDLVLMDVVMPEMDGLEATRLIRTNSAFETLPIIAVSASASDDDRRRYLATTMNAFLPKPLVMGDLLAQVGTLLKLTWTREEHIVTEREEIDSPASLEIPPPEEMQVFHRLARIGNMDDILAHTKYVSELDPRYKSFCSYLGTLAKGYQSKAILKFVKECIQRQIQV